MAGGSASPFTGDEWNDVQRPAKYNSGTPHNLPNPYEIGVNPETGEPPYGVPLFSPDAVKYATGKDKK